MKTSQLTQPPKNITKLTQTKMHSLLFQLAARAVKYYLLVLFGFFTACLLAAIIGVFPEMELFLPSLMECFLRLAALILTFVAIAIVLESIRQ
jgi:cation transport ATPase